MNLLDLLVMLSNRIALSIEAPSTTPINTFGDIEKLRGKQVVRPFGWIARVA